ncbi:MAG: hypothetical protein UHD05_00780 [Ruminococcus sp.]|nr:hypothetical protein [Ruminococcus sp.]
MLAKKTEGFKNATDKSIIRSGSSASTGKSGRQVHLLFRYRCWYFIKTLLLGNNNFC